MLNTHFSLRLLTETPGSEDLVNEFSNDYCTALYYAVVSGFMDIIKLLLEKGGKKTINDTDWEGSTPLHCAAMTGSM